MTPAREKQLQLDAIDMLDHARGSSRGLNLEDTHSLRREVRRIREALEDEEEEYEHEYVRF